MTMNIVAVGKRHESWIQSGIERFESRLKKPFDVKWVLLPHSALSDSAARQDESERILSRLDSRDFVVLLDERGDEIDSPQLARVLDYAFTVGRQIRFIFG